MNDGFPDISAPAALYKAGKEAGLRGEPKSQGGVHIEAGWLRGSVKRRIMEKRVIGVFSNATHCPRCNTTDWGFRLGCRCNTSLEDKTVEYGFLVDDGLADDKPLKFLSFEDAKKTTIPLVDGLTGGPLLVAVEPKEKP
jgi:hypothetical protein